MPVFDFHCHPALKTQFAKSGKEPSPWEFISVELTVLNDIKIKINAAFSDSLDSQSCLQQLLKGGVNLVGVALYATEANIANGLLSIGIVKNGAIKQIDPDKLVIVQAGKNYFDLINNEINFLLSKAKAPAQLNLPTNAKFKLIQNISEYNSEDKNTIHGFLIIEGLHGLMNNPFAANAKSDFIKNLNSFTNKFKIFAVNITHLQQMPLANHAFGIQFLSDDPFYPIGFGITTLGKEIILELYKRKILIDTKHLGLWSRMNLYTIRNNENITLPLVCTHTGVTGISMNERTNYLYDAPKNFDTVWRLKQYKKKATVPNAAFNMSSINLYDEDIIQIIASKGLIGISLDQRIIGFPLDSVTYKLNVFPYDEEYISIQEQNQFFGPKAPNKLPLHEADDSVVMSGDDVENQVSDGLEEIHLYYFWNQIIHILTVAKNNSDKGLTVADAAKRICIGSDFDGLINPIDCCESAIEFATFKNNLKRISNTKGFFSDTVFIKNELNIDQLLDDIFFNNAINFLKINFK